MIVVALAMPLVFRSTSDSVASCWFALAAAAGCVALLGREPRVTRWFGFAGMLTCAMSVWYVVTSPWALLPTGSMVEGARIGATFLLALAAHRAAFRRRDRMAMLACVGVACAVVAVATLFSLPDGGVVRRVPGLLGYWNATAACATVLAVLAVPLVRHERWWVRGGAGSFVLVAGAVLAVTVSRGAMLAFVVGAGWLVVAGRRGERWGVALSAVLVLVLGGFGVAGVGALDAVGWAALAAGSFALAAATAPVAAAARRRAPVRLLQSAGALTALAVVLVVVFAGFVVRLAVVDDAGRRSVDTPVADLADPHRLVAIGNRARLTWWREAFDEWAGRPLTGWGGQAFSLRRTATESSFLPAARPHQLLLQFAVEGGIVALVLAVGAACTLLVAMWRARVVPESLAAGGVATALGAQALWDWTASVPFVTALAAVCVGIAAHRGGTAARGGGGDGASPDRGATTKIDASTLSLLPARPWLAGIAVLAIVPAIGFGLERAAWLASDNGANATAGALSATARLLLPEPPPR